jgi:hypothetical protein
MRKIELVKEGVRGSKETYFVRKNKRHFPFGLVFSFCLFESMYLLVICKK